MERTPLHSPSWPSVVTDRDLQGTLIGRSLRRSRDLPPSCTLLCLQCALTSTEQPTQRKRRCRSSFLEIHLVCLSVDSRPCVHSRCLKRHPRPLRCDTLRSCSIPVVSHHLDGLLRKTVVGLLHPTSDPEVRRIFRFRIPLDRSQSGDRLCPRSAHTPRRIPLIYSRTASL